MFKKIPTPLKIIIFYYLILISLIVIPKPKLTEIKSLTTKNNQELKIKEVFPDENAFQNYLLNEICFPELTFKTIDVKKGDNFWKIAKDSAISIDTLVSNNPFLDSMKAQIGQKIILPNIDGAIHLVPEIEQIESLATQHQISKKELIIENLPKYYEYYHKFFGRKKFITVFIPNNKKLNKENTSQLTKKFEPTESNSDSYENINIREIYPTEQEFIDYLTKEIYFKGVSFKIIKIKKGDNFWKIAKKFKVNINTLIGANPYWDSLLARINQRIVVPSIKGALHFVSELEQVDLVPEIYNTSIDNIIVEDLPEYYEYYHKFYGKKKIIAVFVKDKKPLTANMTTQLAAQFQQRELFRSPLGGRLSSFFGNRKHPILKRQKFHNGIDIATKYGTLVGAARAGRVTFTGWKRGYGKTVVITHDQGYKTLYGHLSKILTRKGRQVKPGWLIGKVGSTGLSTGPHLHFTIWKHGKLINPMDVLW